MRLFIKRLLGSRTPPPQPVLQEYFLRLALEEIGITGGPIKVNHQEGQSAHAAIGTVPIVFPMSYVDRISEMDKHKSRDFFFQGVITEKRAWLREYEDVFDSTYGRNPATKYEFHTEYFANICASRFALAPTGDCPWSYRFLEGVMCHAIPVLGNDDVDVFSKRFIYFRHSDAKRFDPEVCLSNYANFLRNHTLKGLGFG